MSDLAPEEIDALRRVLLVVSEVTENALIVVGGWAARLLRRHPLARPPAYQTLQTKDLDIAATDRLRGTPQTLAGAIRKQGFTPEFRSEDRPPVTRYLLKSMAGFELEFIAPLLGGPVRRDGTPDNTVDLLGVSAQKLRHVELLLLEPSHVAMPELGSDAQIA